MGSTQSHTPQTDPPQAPGAFPASSSAPTGSTSMQPSAPQATAPSTPARSLFPPKFLLTVADLVYGSSAPDTYVPTHEDIAAAYEILQEHRLPPELVPSILERAEYWFVSRVTLKREVTVPAGSRTPRQMVGAVVRWRNGQEDDLIEEIGVDNSGLNDEHGKLWYLVTEPIGSSNVAEEEEDEIGENQEKEDEEQREAGEKPELQVEVKREKPKAWLKKIVVDTLSKDQGWSSSNRQHYGTVNNPTPGLSCHCCEMERRSRVQEWISSTMYMYFKNHTNTMDQDHKLVRMAEAGDRVVLWVRAQYPGWVNHLREATITLFESPFPPQH